MARALRFIHQRLVFPSAPPSQVLAIVRSTEVVAVMYLMMMVGAVGQLLLGLAGRVNPRWSCPVRISLCAFIIIKYTKQKSRLLLRPSSGPFLQG
jgi:hypothetical protein